VFIISFIYVKYENVFSKVEVKYLFAHEKHDHVIDTNDENFLYKSLYNLSNKKFQILQNYLNSILVKSWIQHSVNFVEASVLFILKKHDDLQLCVNYQELNKITVKSHHSLFLINEILNQLSDIKIFIELDLKNVYYCICIKMSDKWKMVFCMCCNHFEYLIMSFKLINTSVIFQIYINRALIKFMNFICIVYLNNILIYLQSKKEHKCHIYKILAQLQHYKLYANLKKYVFFTDIVKFFKFIVLIISMMMNSWWVNIIMNWLILKTF